MLHNSEGTDREVFHGLVLDRTGWARLRDIIAERSYSEGQAIRLASGAMSNVYFNMKLTMSQPEALHLIGNLMLQAMEDQAVDFVGGLEMGAVPIVNAISTRSFETGRPIPLFWVRKHQKDHGTKQLLEGEALANLRGKTAVMVEDVTTSGNSVLRAIEIARAEGMKVHKVITVVDRLEGAKENLSRHGIDLQCLYDAGDFRGSGGKI